MNKTAKLLYTVTFAFTTILGCSKGDGGGTAPVTPPTTGGQNPTTPTNPTPTTVTAKTDAPTDLYIVNIGFADKGVHARVTKQKKATFRGNNNYEDVMGDRKFIHLYGANYNTDGSVPLTEEGQPEAHSKYSVRNNMGVSMAKSENDGAKANMILRVIKGFSFSEQSGRNTGLNVTRLIESGKLALLPVEGKEDEFPFPYDGVKFSDSEINGKDIGNLNIADNPDTETQFGITYAELQEMLGTPGDYLMDGMEISLDDDNKGGANNALPKLAYYPDFIYQ